MTEIFKPGFFECVNQMIVQEPDHERGVLRGFSAVSVNYVQKIIVDQSTPDYLTPQELAYCKGRPNSVAD